ncbi:MurR/RpiR family transcriptional regulator [Thomasclavelia saccharogumia]|uniref:MurR/RpiR family transcriptional regulator n=1 Tax=Thomasclavelia saccharogumia TaxID=341225 RepID=UPI00047EF630|nr:MurR/RpiR family transcriptional regulator [Thomasclavelia saccharogumia]
MYIIDKLKMVNNTAQTDSIEFILSKYFLKNLLNLKKVSLKRISLETGLSKSTVIRFCQRAGFSGFTVFIDELSLEALELNNILKSYQHMDLIIYENIKADFIKQCKNQLREDVYHNFLDLIKNSSKILFYGHNKYISCFHLSTSYLLMMGKDVIDNMCWDIKKQNLLFSDLKENDLIIIVEPYMNWRNYKELLTITMDALQNLNDSKAKIAFIGQDTNENVDISIALPYTYYETLYKDFIIYLDMMLVTDLK